MKIPHGLTWLALLACSGAVQAQDAVQVRSWAAGCTACHGTLGHAQPGLAPLAGLRQEDIVRKMQDFKTGRVPATVMQQLAKGYSDAQIVAMAAYFAAQKP